MGFVKTSEEIARLEREFSRPRFVSGERLTVEFLTDPAIVERLLPPPLQPAQTPLVLASVGRWQGSCIGDYAGGSIYLAAGHDGIDGGYPLAMWMDSEASVVFGREVFGEPKKLATMGLFRNGDHVHGYLERRGARLLDLHADLGADAGPTRTDAFAFNYKARPAANGVGLDGPARLTVVHFRGNIKSQREGTGTVTLGATVHDPLDEIPVVSVVRAVFQEHDMVGTCEEVATVPADQFLPYYYGRTDDWLAMADSAPPGARAVG